MFKNYLVIAMRNLMRYQLYSAINITGLAIGLAGCILISLFIKDELNYDRFHEQADQIYRVIWHGKVGSNEWKTALGPVPVAEALSNFPEVAFNTRFRLESKTIRRGSEYVKEKRFFYVERSFFDVFSVSFVFGTPETALEDLNSVVLTEESAQRYFPNQNPVGQTLELNDGSSLRITGVVKGFPRQSHFHFDFLASLRSLRIVKERQNRWGAATVYTYLILKKGSHISQLESKLQKYVDGLGLEEKSSFPLQRLTDIHLRSRVEWELAPNGNITYVYGFSIIGIIILALACINFLNLSTASGSVRAREVGMRKVLGSHRSQLVGQFLFESFLYMAIAIVLAFILCHLGLPILNDITSKQLTTTSLYSPFVVMTLGSLLVVVTILAGLYPAFYLSSLWPDQLFKGRVVSLVNRSGRQWLRSALVGVQFCISISLLVGTFIVHDQIYYVQTKSLGFHKEHVIVLHGARDLGMKALNVRNQLRKIPQVMAASLTHALPGHTFSSVIVYPEQPANYPETSLPFTMVDEDFVKTLGVKVLEGRNFSLNEFPTDASAILLNQAAVKTLGWQEGALGKQVKIGGGRGITGQVIGVVEDFHFESLHHEIRPLMLPFIQWRPAFIILRVKPDNIADALSAIRQVWNKVVPNQFFEYSFLDQDYQNLYNSEQRIAVIFKVFVILAIFIACIGLFGLLAFIAETRTKEIGIRKVLGATTSSIVLLLAKDVIQPISIAFLAAIPISYYFSDLWLTGFTYHIEIGYWTFMLGGCLVFLIALITVSWQTVKIAKTNPADILRLE